MLERFQLNPLLVDFLTFVRTSRWDKCNVHRQNIVQRQALSIFFFLHGAASMFLFRLQQLKIVSLRSMRNMKMKEKRELLV